MDQSFRQSLKESTIHGNERFPFGAYWYQFAPGAHVVDSHWHKEAEIFYVMEGEVLFQIDSEYIPVRAGEAIFIDGGDLHTGHAQGDQGCSFCAMVFDFGMLASPHYDLVQEGMIIPFQERRATFPRRMTFETDDRLLGHIKEMIGLSEQKPAGYEAAIKGHLFLMLFEAASTGRLANRSRSETADITRTERLKKVILYIQNHYHRPIRLSELAELIPMSEGQFCRFFKSMTGQTPVDYMNSYRVRQAAELLRQPDNKISDIALDVGFGHISYFVRVFRKIMNCTPSEYRKKL
ncbi:helix-turn-helix transcriptional regulator [Paenibacillus glucanolyticus]|uniref:helix-turn-helix transcriptional regulator n=1 Tax=Paenibacillus glucanolyticus TaxID=59843 RepID=UPI00096EE7B0|nr:AraC family transcriptional regulator [Paenibacillus glucanolyticus]OMF77127.1 AraC family transcriptional regulator [Paenibacillus glucanolyticus]